MSFVLVLIVVHASLVLRLLSVRTRFFASGQIVSSFAFVGTDSVAALLFAQFDCGGRRFLSTDMAQKRLLKLENRKSIARLSVQIKGGSAAFSGGGCGGSLRGKRRRSRSPSPFRASRGRDAKLTNSRISEVEMDGMA